MVWRRDAGFRLATFWTTLSLISSISIMVMSPLGTPGDVPEVGSTVTVQGAFSAPLVVLSCSAAHGLGNQCPSCSRSARITSLFSPTCRSSPLSLICPCVLLLVVSRLFCPCSCYVLIALITLLPSVPLCCRIRSTEIRQLVWSADSAGRLWNLRFLAAVIYCLLFCVLWRELKFLPLS